MLNSRRQECDDKPNDDKTMRRLMLLRHAKTERAEPGGSDRERKLAPRGRADAPKIGAYMARHGFVPDLALVSAAKRAKETWALIEPAFAARPRVTFDERLYQAGPDQLLDVIRETSGARSLAVIGHNPGLHDLAVQLIAAGNVDARQRVSEGLPTSGLVVIDLAFDDWSQLHSHAGRLERFVSPRLLAAATD
jgi:phosphohistidine phosphatase